jgi:hypothetical protein
VDDGDAPAALAGNVRVGVAVRRPAVRRPARVADADRASRRLLFQVPRQFYKPAGLLADV